MESGGECKWVHCREATAALDPSGWYIMQCTSKCRLPVHKGCFKTLERACGGNKALSGGGVCPTPDCGAKLADYTEMGPNGLPKLRTSCRPSQGPDYKENFNKASNEARMRAILEKNRLGDHFLPMGSRDMEEGGSGKGKSKSKARKEAAPAEEEPTREEPVEEALEDDVPDSWDAREPSPEPPAPQPPPSAPVPPPTLAAVPLAGKKSLEAELEPPSGKLSAKAKKAEKKRLKAAAEEAKAKELGVQYVTGKPGATAHLPGSSTAFYEPDTSFTAKGWEGTVDAKRPGPEDADDYGTVPLAFAKDGRLVADQASMSHKDVKQLHQMAAQGKEAKGKSESKEEGDIMEFLERLQAYLLEENDWVELHKDQVVLALVETYKARPAFKDFLELYNGSLRSLLLRPWAGFGFSVTDDGQFLTVPVIADEKERLREAQEEAEALAALPSAKPKIKTRAQEFTAARQEFEQVQAEAAAMFAKSDKGKQGSSSRSSLPSTKPATEAASPSQAKAPLASFQFPTSKEKELETVVLELRDNLNEQLQAASVLSEEKAAVEAAHSRLAYENEKLKREVAEARAQRASSEEAVGAAERAKALQDEVTRLAAQHKITTQNLKEELQDERDQRTKLQERNKDLEKAEAKREKGKAEWAKLTEELAQERTSREKAEASLVETREQLAHRQDELTHLKKELEKDAGQAGLQDQLELLRSQLNDQRARAVEAEVLHITYKQKTFVRHYGGHIQDLRASIDHVDLILEEIQLALDSGRPVQDSDHQSWLEYKAQLEANLGKMEADWERLMPRFEETLDRLRSGEELHAIDPIGLTKEPAAPRCPPSPDLGYPTSPTPFLPPQRRNGHSSDNAASPARSPAPQLTNGHASPAPAQSIRTPRQRSQPPPQAHSPAPQPAESVSQAPPPGFEVQAPAPAADPVPTPSPAPLRPSASQNSVASGGSSGGASSGPAAAQPPPPSASRRKEFMTEVRAVLRNGIPELGLPGVNFTEEQFKKIMGRCLKSGIFAGVKTDDVGVVASIALPEFHRALGTGLLPQAPQAPAAPAASSHPPPPVPPAQAPSAAPPSPAHAASFGSAATARVQVGAAGGAGVRPMAPPTSVFAAPTPAAATSAAPATPTPAAAASSSSTTKPAEDEKDFSCQICLGDWRLDPENEAAPYPEEKLFPCQSCHRPYHEQCMLDWLNSESGAGNRCPNCNKLVVNTNDFPSLGDAGPKKGGAPPPPPTSSYAAASRRAGAGTFFR